MAMTIDLNNAQFRQFVQFAEMQATPAKSEAVARVTGERDALAGRTITAATNDRVHHWYNYTGARSDTNATENNDARALFREAVFSMFGGEANVPESVKGAMKLADYDQGKPLTARRIIAVRDAVLQAADEVSAGAMDRKKAESLVDAAINNFDCEMSANRLGKSILGRDLQAKAVELVRTHAKGLTDACQRILANYVIAAMHSENRDGEERLDGKLSVLADYLRNVRNFKPGEDYRLAALDEQMKQYLQDAVADGKGDADGLSSAFKRHAGTATFTINGQSFAKGTENAGAVVDKFKEVVANPQHRKAISAVMNRSLKNAIVSIHNREALKPTTNFPGLNLSEVKGAELTLTAPKGDQSFKKTCPVERLVPSFTLTVEGNKAKLTCHAPGQLCFKFNNHFAKNGSTNFFMGDVDNYVECEFDLSDPATAKLTSVHFGQTVEMPEREKAVQGNWAHI